MYHGHKFEQVALVAAKIAASDRAWIAGNQVAVPVTSLLWLEYSE